MNSLLLIGSLVFGLNATTNTTPSEVLYVDVETVSHVYNHETDQVEAVSYIEQEEAIELGFNAATYLPIGFDPYEANSGLTNEQIDGLFEEEIAFTFDTTKYLPADFNPYSANDKITDEELDALFEEDIELGFNLNMYLPKNFNAYEGMETIK